MSPPAVASTSPAEPRPARIEILYVDGGPHHEPVLARVRELLTPAHERPLIELVRVDSDDDARARRFLGSPTVRIDGGDIEPGADERTDYGLKCRLYRTAAGLVGTPDDAALVAALERGDEPHQAPAAALARLGLTDPHRARAAALARLGLTDPHRARAAALARLGLTDPTARGPPRSPARIDGSTGASWPASPPTSAVRRGCPRLGRCARDRAHRGAGDPSRGRSPPG